MIELLRYPYPYKAWFTIANDPDNTLIKDWHELNEVIWNKYKLPLSNSLFVDSYNKHLPKQVNLNDHPEITSQYHDMIHTWGDYMHSGKVGFCREYALRAKETLEYHKVKPLVWIDHSKFIGNLIHNNKNGGIPEFKDSSGHVYPNLLYSLDLISELGIKYLWDGDITKIIGQDKVLKPSAFFKEITPSRLRANVKTLLNIFVKSSKLKSVLGLNVPTNSAYFKKEFPDGQKFYCFRRYGTWKNADIYGLGKILAKEKIAKLIKDGGTMVAYTHLGKRPIDKMDELEHVPKHTHEALMFIKDKYDEQNLMISPISGLLDYLVLRDNIQISANLLEFMPDGIRFKNIKICDLKGKTFSFKLNSSVNDLKVKTNGVNLDYTVQNHNDNIVSITF